jgi:hypothetical protein
MMHEVGATASRDELCVGGNVNPDDISANGVVKSYGVLSRLFPKLRRLS